jgi:hypothetical protein
MLPRRNGGVVVLMPASGDDRDALMLAVYVFGITRYQRRAGRGAE